ncbi:P-loop NTPase family protein [Entomobacter blattae]|uniref:ABC transporter domain-containing protein n=1 Tax=Entomobacter blattae TaxID=2762277 RepID=A0A7H1NRD5_9PROT|nr:ABC transporter ATP-binding protein [Entomobacter blattae]QNT78345.1 hypothetical protein JGUZn3_11180 [Entomobacter blattae]
MSGIEPLLEMQDVLPYFEQTVLPPAIYNFRVFAGQFILIECRNAFRGNAFADMCLGMVGLKTGSIRFMGLDWAKLQLQQKNALRGRVGRYPHIQGNWMNLLGTHFNIMFQQLHHTKRETEEIVHEATALSRRFGLPGLPVEAPEMLSDVDRARAACVRAFMGSPSLVLLEYCLEDYLPELKDPLFRTINNMQSTGTAVISFTRDRFLWKDYNREISGFYRLRTEGLVVSRGGIQ